MISSGIYVFAKLVRAGSVGSRRPKVSWPWDSFQNCAELGLGRLWQNVADGLEEKMIAESVEPHQCGIVDFLEAAPRSMAVDDL